MIPFDPATRDKELAVIEQKMAEPTFWDDPDAARRLLRRMQGTKEPLDRYRTLASSVDDLLSLIEIANEESDLAMSEELETEARRLGPLIDEFEVSVLLTGPYDSANALVALHPGAGGTESQDWAEMLMRMYLKWAERKGFKTEILDLIEGDEAGIKGVTVMISGANAYGFLRPERGVHRLVRISPFDSSGRRHTSFASVDISPEIEDDEDLVISPEDLRVDTYRASGAGGQHINKTDSAVRITHLPTGTVVTCQQERSQHANRESAMRILHSRLLRLKEEQREKELNELRGETKDSAWGSQLRSYVLQPYSLIKDHRTGIEVGNVQAVLDGDIDAFIYGVLQSAAATGRDRPTDAGR